MCHYCRYGQQKKVILHNRDSPCTIGTVPIEQMKKITAILFSVMSVLSCSRKPVTGPAVLIGDIEGDFDECYVVTFPLDKLLDYNKVNPQDGHFELVLDNVDGFMDLVVQFTETDYFGGRINANDTLRMTFTRTPDGHFHMAYHGACEQEARIWTDWFSTYDLSQYNIRSDKDPDITCAQSLSLLSEKDSAFRAGNRGKLSPYHLRRADLRRDFIKAVLIESDAYDNGLNHLDNPDYAALVKDVDPNDPYILGSGLLARWANYAMKDMGNDEISRNLRFMKEYKGRITSADALASLADKVAGTLIMSPELFDDEGKDAYVSAVRDFAGDMPELYESMLSAYAAFKATRKGADMPDVEMTAPDGSKVMLSSLFGKVIYIDMWATWCGPCVREIPHMAALAGRMKDRSDILCISVSTDDTAEPWLEHIEATKPSWPQYMLGSNAVSGFCRSMNISAIPRFIIVGRDGKIYDPDAVRPSDPSVDAVLAAAASDF